MANVHVTFIDAATNQVIGDAKLPPDHLPESFRLSTTLQLGTDSWHVERADPSERGAYVATGRLQLWLRKIETIDSGPLRFSLPTIEDALPPLRPGNAETAYALHEDEWRQRELVTRRFAHEIATELQQIRAIHAESSGGYERVHVRSRIPEPLAGITFSVRRVRAVLGDVDPSELAIGDDLVVGGFVFASAVGAVYGREEQNRVVTLALAGDTSAESLLPIADEYGLVIVEWVRAEVL